MENVIKNLQEKPILHQEQVLQIKRYIEKKYPTSSKKEKATIFANAVHQVVDQSVIKFEEKHRIQIRTEVLKSAIAKEIFDINGYDVFEVCALLPLDDNTSEKSSFFEKLTEWINENQEIQLTQEDVSQMATQVLDNAVNALVIALEETMLVEPEIKANVKIKEDQSSQVPKSSPTRIPSNLSAKDIEKALSEPLDGLPEVRFSNEPPSTKSDEFNPELKPEPKPEPKPELKQEFNPEPKPELKPEPKPELKNEQPIKVINIDDIVVEVPDAGHEDYDSLDIALTLNSKKDRGTEVLRAKDWEELNIDTFISDQQSNQTNKAQHNSSGKQKLIATANQLGGYDKHTLFEETRKKEILQVKILMIVLVSIVSIAVIIFLIVGAILVSNKKAQRELDVRLSSLETQSNIAYDVSATDVSLMSLVNQSLSDTEDGTLVQEKMTLHMDELLKYRDIDRDLIVTYLTKKNSLLVESDYLEQLIQIAKDYDVNPLLLLSIIGQEQGFVPKTHKDAQKIINNPFNVYNSWLTYNTDFNSSCTIAARTIISSSLNCPEEIDPIVWINRIYAEDESWHKGVTYFYTTLSSLSSGAN